MISHRTTFVAYEIIAPWNAYLDDDNVLEAIRINSIVVEVMVMVMVKDKMKQICIKDTFHVLKLQANLFSVSKLLLNGLKNAFEPMNVFWEV